MMVEKIKRLAEDNFNNTLADRRHLHKHPELSFQEFKTQEYVWQRLSEIGVDKNIKLPVPELWR